MAPYDSVSLCMALYGLISSRCPIPAYMNDPLAHPQRTPNPKKPRSRSLGLMTDDSVATETAGNAPPFDRRRYLARIHPSVFTSFCQITIRQVKTLLRFESRDVVINEAVQTYSELLRAAQRLRAFLISSTRNNVTSDV